MTVVLYVVLGAIAATLAAVVYSLAGPADRLPSPLQRLRAAADAGDRWITRPSVMAMVFMTVGLLVIVLAVSRQDWIAAAVASLALVYVWVRIQRRS